MLHYYKENVSIEEFIEQLLEIEQDATVGASSLKYILVPASQTELTFKDNYLTPKIINRLDKIKLIKIESWTDLYEVLDVLIEDSQNLGLRLDNITIAFYGIFKHFIKSEKEVTNFVNANCDSAREINQLCHYWFKNHLEYGFRVFINDSMGAPETSSMPLLWQSMISKVNETNEEICSRECNIQLSYVFMRWVKIFTLHSYTQGKKAIAC